MFKNILSLVVIVSLLMVSSVYAQIIQEDAMVNSFTFDNNCQVNPDNADEMLCEGYEQVWLEFSCYRGDGGSASLEMINGQAIISRIADCVERSDIDPSLDKVVNHKNDIILHVGVINLMWKEGLQQFFQVMLPNRKYYTVTTISSDVERNFLFRTAKETNNRTINKKNVTIGTSFELVKMNNFTFKNVDIKSTIRLGVLETGESVYVDSVTVYSVN